MKLKVDTNEPREAHLAQSGLSMSRGGEPTLNLVFQADGPGPRVKVTLSLSEAHGLRHHLSRHAETALARRMHHEAEDGATLEAALEERADAAPTTSPREWTCAESLQRRFVEDMRDLGIEPRIYGGYGGYYGFGADSNHEIDESEIFQATEVPCASDPMGLGVIVYPRKRLKQEDVLRLAEELGIE